MFSTLSRYPFSTSAFLFVLVYCADYYTLRLLFLSMITTYSPILFLLAFLVSCHLHLTPFPDQLLLFSNLFSRSIVDTALHAVLLLVL